MQPVDFDIHWLMDDYPNLRVNKSTQIILFQNVNAEQYLRKHANLDIIIYSLNMYHSLVHTHFSKLTYKVTFSSGFNSLAWEVELSRPSSMSNPILAYFMKNLHLKSQTFESRGY